MNGNSYSARGKDRETGVSFPGRLVFALFGALVLASVAGACVGCLSSLIASVPKLMGLGCLALHALVLSALWACGHGVLLRMPWFPFVCSVLALCCALWSFLLPRLGCVACWSSGCSCVLCFGGPRGCLCCGSPGRGGNLLPLRARLAGVLCPAVSLWDAGVFVVAWGLALEPLRVLCLSGGVWCSAQLCAA